MDPDNFKPDLLSRSLPGRKAIMMQWLHARPLIPPALGLVIGIIIDNAWCVPAGFALAAFLLAGGVIAFARKSELICYMAVALAAAASGVVLHDYSYRRWPANHVVRYAGADSTAVRLTGTVVTSPSIRPVRSGLVQWFSQLPRTRMTVRAETIQGTEQDIAVSGLVSVLVREPVHDVCAGDRVELFGKIYKPSGPMNPGARDWARFNRRNGVLVQMTCEHAANIRVKGVGSLGYSWTAQLRRRARAAMLEQTFAGDLPGAQMLSAMVLGQRSGVKPELNQAFVDTGTAHYLSVSGAHVGMLASVVWLFGWLAGFSRRRCAGWAMILITAYALLAEPRLPILRAALMADLLCLAILMRRPVISANWLALAAIVLLVFKPTQLFMPGFQLSFAAVAALIFFTPRFHESAVSIFYKLIGRDDPLLMPQMQKRINPPTVMRSLVNWFIRVFGWWLAIGFSLWLVSSLIIAFHFQHIALWGWLNTILVLPFFWMALVLGLAKTVITAVCPPVGGVIAVGLAFVSDRLIDLVSFLSLFPGAGMPTPAIPLWLVVGGFAVLCFWVVYPWLRVSVYWPAVVGVVLVISAVCRLGPAGDSQALRLRVLSVGDGNCCVLNLPNGRTIIYDIGARPPYDLERFTVGPVLALERIYKIDAVVLSHANLDHYSGLLDLIDRRRVGEVLSAVHFMKHPDLSRGAKLLVTELEQGGMAWRIVCRGDSLAGTGDVDIRVLWPPPLDSLHIADLNDTSVVLSISYAGRRILLCGDIEEIPQQQLMASGDLKADVLVLPHHGGVVATTGEFIEAVDPEYCIRSSRQTNRNTGNGLLEILAGRRYYNTADNGAILVLVTRSQLTVEPWLIPEGE